MTETLNFTDFLARSERFFAAFPTMHNRAKLFADTPEKQQEVVHHAAHSYPLLHHEVGILVTDFLAYKKEHGSPVEKELYTAMDRDALLDRLLTKRPLMFMTEMDSYILRNGDTGSGGFETIGTDKETPPLLLADYLSYDEMQISALIGISSPTHFINRGGRNNQGEPEAEESFEAKGVYVGLVGARFEKTERMEWSHMIVSPQQNTTHNGYGAKAPQDHPHTKKAGLWAKFYKQPYLPSHEEASNDSSGRFVPLGQDHFLDSQIYKQRLRMSIEPFLRDADDRAKENGTQAYVHAVGLGLGVWQLSPVQAHLMMDVYTEILQENTFHHIADINFSWFPDDCTNCAETSHGEICRINGNQIKIHFSKRDPAEKLQDDDKGKLLVASYAWDGNAFPGNEYWAGSLSASGDPAAACCSQIAELQNPYINPALTGKNARFIRTQTAQKRTTSRPQAPSAKT